MEQFITIIVLIVGAGLSAWVKKKQQDQERGASPWDGPTAEGESDRPAAPPPRRATLPPLLDTFGGPQPLEDLRRMLGGEKKSAPNATPSKPASWPSGPLIIPPLAGEGPAGTPAALQQADRQLVQKGKLEKAATSYDAGRRMQESAQAFMRGSQLPQRVTADLDAVGARTASPNLSGIIPRIAPAGTEAARVQALLRHPRTLREVVLASMILSDPKSLV